MPVRFAYDTRGRLDTVKQGTGSSERTTTFSYQPTTGFLASVTDPEGRVLTIDLRDAAGRVQQATLPGARVVGFGYDPKGSRPPSPRPGGLRTSSATPPSTRSASTSRPRSPSASRAS